MKPFERQDEIVKELHRHGQISVEYLACSLGVSRETIRRDLHQLDSKGRLKKFHGGARIKSSAGQEPSVEGPFALRMAENLAAKRRIAAAAARLLAPGDTLFMDAGTTTLALAEALVALPPLVVITNASRIAEAVAANANHKVFLIGGAFAADAGEALGHLAIEQIRKFRAQHAFLTIGAVDADSLMDFDAQETEIARAMIERVERVTVLADHSKLGKRGMFEVAPWSAVERLVTDQPPPTEIAEAARSHNVQIVLPRV